MGSLAACTPIGDGTRESCVGPYTGTFKADSAEGALEGRILAYFGQPNVQTEEPELELTLTFDTETSIEIPDRLLEAAVAESGDVTSLSNNFEIDGTFDFEDCKPSGSWEGSAFSNGTWELSFERGD
jgi:hypothetical protein